VCRKQTFEGAAHQNPLIGAMSERPLGSGIHGEHAKTSAITSFGLGDRGVSGLERRRKKTDIPMVMVRRVIDTVNYSS
jgi:hypothetical protein